jgi:hypothetical protein
VPTILSVHEIDDDLEATLGPGVVADELFTNIIQQSDERNL